MKIRTGFVSNSSTTSFCIYGVSFSDKNDFKNQYGISLYDFDLKGLTYHHGQYGSIYIGLDDEDIGMDETRRQFQDRVAKLIKEVFPDINGADLSWHEESYYDG